MNCSRRTASSGSRTISSSSHSISIASTRGLRLAERVGGDGGDRRAGVADLLLETFRLAGPDRRAHARQRERRREVDLLHARVRVRRAEHGRLQHPGQPDVGGVARLAAHALGAGLARRRPADDLARPGGPLLERILLDDDPDLLEPALDFLLGANQSCHVRIASSIFGYVPQRQMFPAIACLISSRVGSGFAATSAAAETTWPGVQKPHWTASVRTNASTSGWSRSPSIVVTSPSTVCASVMHESRGTPSTWTVHAPQCPSAHAIFVPVRPSRSRRTDASVVPTGGVEDVLLAVDCEPDLAHGVVTATVSAI